MEGAWGLTVGSAYWSQPGPVSRSQSDFGAFLDPVADKLLVCACLVLLTGAMGMAVAIPTTVIVSREIAVSALREWMASRGKSGLVAVGWWGKLKTAAQMTSLLLLLAARAGERDVPFLTSSVPCPPLLPLLAPAQIQWSAPAGHPTPSPVDAACRWYGLALLNVATGLTITSGFAYFRAALASAPP